MGVRYDEKSCGVLVFRKKDDINLFLLLHYPGGHWDFAKGHCEKGESEKQTASRELLEETGISDIEFVGGFREEVAYRYQKSGRPSHKQVVFFLAETKLANIKLSHEHHDFRWLPYSAAFNKLTFDNAKNLLRKANLLLLSKHENQS